MNNRDAITTLIVDRRTAEEFDLSLHPLKDIAIKYGYNKLLERYLT